MYNIIVITLLCAKISYSQIITNPKIHWLLEENNSLELYYDVFDCEVALTRKKVAYNDCGKAGLINKSGKIIIPPTYCAALGLYYLGESMYLYFPNENNAKLRGIFNSTGKQITPPVYQYIGEFNEGLAVIMRNNKYGYIDKDGKEFVRPIYERVYNFSEGIGVLVNELNTTFINRQGKLLKISNFYASGPFSSGLCEVYNSNTNLCGYINKNFELEIGFKYLGTETFINGLAKVSNANYDNSIINRKGEYVTPPKNCVIDIYKDYIRILDSKTRVVNYYKHLGSGISMFPLKGNDDTQYHFFEFLSKFEHNGKYGFVNPYGQIVIQPIYDEAGNFYEGLSDVKIGNKWGYINKKGELVYGFIFDETNSFKDNAAVVIINGRTGLLLRY